MGNGNQIMVLSPFQQRLPCLIVRHHPGHGGPESRAVVGVGKVAKLVYHHILLRGQRHHTAAGQNTAFLFLGSSSPTGCSCPAPQCGAFLRAGRWRQTAGNTAHIVPASGAGRWLCSAAAVRRHGLPCGPPSGPAPRQPIRHAPPQKRPHCSRVPGAAR